MTEDYRPFSPSDLDEIVSVFPELDSEIKKLNEIFGNNPQLHYSTGALIGSVGLSSAPPGERMKFAFLLYKMEFKGMIESYFGVKSPYSNNVIRPFETLSDILDNELMDPETNQKITPIPENIDAYWKIS